MHSDSAILYNSFLDQHKDREVPANKMFDLNYKANVKNVREAIAPIVDSIRLCGRQNTQLQGQRDNGKNQPDLGKSLLTNTGKFIEFLNYRIRGGDKALRNNLWCAQQNAKYISPEFQNDLILCCRDLIVKNVTADVKESKYYTIIADEATYCPLKQQIALILKFADKSSTIREAFVSFLECSYGLSDQSLFKTIKEFLDSNGIDISDCKGQGYDSAEAVAGKNQGLAAHFLRINSKALYTHCSCHRLNLAVVTACGEQRIQNLMTNIKEISDFFN